MLNLVLPRKLIVPLDGMKNILHICCFLPLCNYGVQNIHSLLSFPWEFSVLDAYWTLKAFKNSSWEHKNNVKHVKMVVSCLIFLFCSYFLILLGSVMAFGGKYWSWVVIRTLLFHELFCTKLLLFVGSAQRNETLNICRIWDQLRVSIGIQFVGCGCKPYGTL